MCQYLPPSSDCVVCGGDGVDAESVRGKWLRCRCTLNTKVVVDTDLQWWVLVKGWKIIGKITEYRYRIQQIQPELSQSPISDDTWVEFNKNLKQEVERRIGLNLNRGIPAKEKDAPLEKPKPTERRKRRKPRHRNLPKPKVHIKQPEPERERERIPRRVEPKWHAGSDIGDSIPGSRYIRDYCSHCGVPIRVESINGNLCADCNPRKRLIGTTNSDVIKADIQYHGKYQKL